MSNLVIKEFNGTVAPSMGAWIEIYWVNDVPQTKAKSLPAWERGLKYDLRHYHASWLYVAPSMGAWIEILPTKKQHTLAGSLPAWERGLKLTRLITVAGLKLSLPAWERGLK